MSPEAPQLALIADVHSNLEALDAVLADIDSTVPEARLICAGDLVGYGPNPIECIERLRERRALAVIGNHDEMVAQRRGFSRCNYAGITAALELADGNIQASDIVRRRQWRDTLDQVQKIDVRQKIPITGY